MIYTRTASVADTLTKTVRLPVSGKAKKVAEYGVRRIAERVYRRVADAPSTDVAYTMLADESRSSGAGDYFVFAGVIVRTDALTALHD